MLIKTDMEATQSCYWANDGAEMQRFDIFFQCVLRKTKHTQLTAIFMTGKVSWPSFKKNKTKLWVSGQTKMKNCSLFFQGAESSLLALSPVCLLGNMMSRGQRGSEGQRQKATINGSLNKMGANITNSPLPQPDLAKVGREFLVAHGAGQTAWLLKLLFAVMGLGFEKWKSTFNWPIKRKQSSRSSDTEQRANRISFISW